MRCILRRLCGLALAAVWAIVAAAAQAPHAIVLPGTVPFDAALQNRLWQAWQDALARGHLPSPHPGAGGSTPYINRLIFESSPYLQEHALNPVNWYPWSPEAFATARREHKPIFLSVGYSSCHWCHVMERECFENVAIARLLNEHFIAVKVDRESRPDVDRVYVEAVEHMTGTAGWPLTVLLTPEGKPFYGGTYFPPEDRGGHPGLPKVLATVSRLWETKRDQVLEAGDALTRELQPAPASTAAVGLTDATLRQAYETLSGSFDAAHAGFGTALKFPQAYTLQFLLRYWQRAGVPAAREMALETLRHIAAGGIRDQLDGGFHRYATDAAWRVPHFEKMLYDQALDVGAFLEAAQATGDAGAAAVARDTLAAVRRELTEPGGAFAAAVDADSAGGEGRFYTWTRDEIVGALGPDRGPLIADFYDVPAAGVMPDGRTPLSAPVPVVDFARRRGLDASAFAARLAQATAALRAVRDRRPQPPRDDEIVTGWNGLMIASLAYGSVVLREPADAAAAAQAADFLLARAQRGGRLLHGYRDGPSRTGGYLDDYAFFIRGLDALYAATFEVRWLREADRLTREMLRLFGGDARGGLTYIARDGERLIAAPAGIEDDALPAAQSVAALELLRLGRLTMNAEFERRGRALLDVYSTQVAAAPAAHTSMLMALDFALGPTQEIVIAGPVQNAATRALLAVVHAHYLPRALVVLYPPGAAAIEALAPFVKQQPMRAGRPTAYVCENYVCKLPTGDPRRLDGLLAQVEVRRGSAAAAGGAAVQPGS